MQVWTRSRIAIALALAIATTTAAATQSAERPLPDVALALADGTPATLHGLAGEGQWLIVYVAATSPPAARLLEALTTWELGAQTSRIVVVTTADVDVRALAAQWSERLPGTRWAADPSNAFARGLGIRGAPTVVGARGRQAAWVLAGVLNDPSMVRDVVKSWIP
jgi:hypothetical protein